MLDSAIDWVVIYFNSKEEAQYLYYKLLISKDVL